MTKKVEASVEDRLRALYSLQLVDSRIDELRSMRGELPLEVQDLEDEIEGLKNRLEKLKEELKSSEEVIKDKKNTIEDSKALIKRYTEQQKNVRNNREYNSLAKEMEYQELEVQLAEKHIREYKEQNEFKKEVITQTMNTVEERTTHLNHKKAELEAIMAETQKEEDLLISKSKEYQERIEDRLLNAYNKIRKNVKNGLAVVAVERGASGGSFFTIPPQVQLEIAARKKIITDEHSGRILVDPELAQEEQERLQEVLG